ncbi:MAG: cytochrome b [Planctomycetota bacterium]|jgi:ubiquinol-cytochrome c reductase cytochrome b subunit
MEYGAAPVRRDRWPNFGLLALVVAAGGLVTGVFLAFNYAPTLEAARDSVAFIQNEVTLGRLLRGLHHWAGNLALVLAAIHGWRLFWHGAYKAPRRLLWVLGGLIFLVLLGFAYTGYLLPGDERAYTGLGVMEGIAGSTPVLGEEVRTVLKGGDVVSSAMLARLHTVHTVILPAALLGLVVAFVAAWRRRGPAPHHADHRDESEEAAPLPAAALKRDAAYSILALALLALLAWLVPPALGAKLDPTGAGAADAKPEWFFLWVNEALRLAGGHTFLIGAVLPGALVALAFAVPLVFRGRARAPRRRKPELIAALLILGAIGGLTVSSLAAHPAAPAVPETEPGAAGDLEAQAAQVMEKFKCASCHVIDGGESDQETGPPLTRRATADLPAFGALYRREFFRRKVGDPKGFWAETSMRYTPKRLKPTPEELAVLERWFFLDDEK